MTTDIVKLAPENLHVRGCFLSPSMASIGLLLMCRVRKVTYWPTKTGCQHFVTSLWRDSHILSEKRKDQLCQMM